MSSTNMKVIIYVTIFLNLLNICGLELQDYSAAENSLLSEYDYRKAPKTNKKQHNVLKSKGSKKKKHKQRMMGGQPADIGIYSFVVGIGKHVPEDSFWRVCGGAILSKRWVVTAAQCFDYITDAEVKNKTVFVFANHIIFSGGYRHRIYKYIVHEEYSSETKDNDIALVKVKEIFDGDYEQRVPFVKKHYDYIDESAAILLAWGPNEKGTSSNNREAKGSDILYYANVELFNTPTCKTFWKDKVTDRMVCAGSEGRGICRGDIGSPLYQSDVIIGIASFTDNKTECSGKKRPGVFTKLSEFRTWLHDKTCINSTRHPI